MCNQVRISPSEARKKVLSGEALLVCAYDNEEAFDKARLAGAVSLDGLRSRIPALAPDSEIIFYCG